MGFAQVFAYSTGVLGKRRVFPKNPVFIGENGDTDICDFGAFNSNNLGAVIGNSFIITLSF
jgi:hypothetical protein